MFKDYCAAGKKPIKGEKSKPQTPAVIGHVRYIKCCNMALRLSGQTSLFGGVFLVSKSLLGIERQRKLKKIAVLTRKPWIDVRILIY